MRTCTLALGLMLGMTIAVPAQALQCVPYARQISGVDLQGDAWRWWNAAQGVYDRGASPRSGAVLVFKQTRNMRYGHVAVVRRVINKREIRIDHANWGTGLRGSRGTVTTDVPVIDVSPNNDWSQVRVWHHASQTYGARINPAYGFIYAKGGARPSFDDEHRHVPPAPASPHVIHSVSVTTLPSAPAAASALPPVSATMAALQLPPSTPAAAAAPVVAEEKPQPQAAAAPQQHLAGAARLNAQVLARLQGHGTGEGAAKALQSAQPAPKPVKRASVAKVSGKTKATLTKPLKVVAKAAKPKAAAKVSGVQH